MVKCEVCDGTGVEERERVINGLDSDGPYVSIWPYYRDCEQCRGNGEIDND